MHAVKWLFFSGLLLVGCGAPMMKAPPATFTQIYTAMFPLGTKGQCNYCHNRPANDISNGKLNLGETQAAAYAALVGPDSVSAKCGGAGKKLVAPGDPDASLFLQKFQTAPPCGDRMPQGATPLTDVQLEMVRSWIAAGAQDD